METFGINSGPCAKSNCDRQAHARGLCRTHYYHSTRARQPLRPPRTCGSGNPGNPLTPLAERLKSIRLSCDLDQEKFAALIGTHQATISNWELGVRMPTLKSLQRYAELRDTTVSQLLDGVL